ncbi:MAG: phosphoglycerate dehydrogenase [Calditrichia bacterium]|nr:phosphoglycerate dehydrogenase [Calditrichia bacterium]
MYKILVADSLPKHILEKYDKSKNITVDNKSGISKEELMEILPEYDGLVVRSRTKVTADVLAKGDKLKVIGRAGAGVDNIDTDESTNRGIIVMNTPGGNTIAATEHTLAMMLAVMRNIPRANMSLLDDKWDRKTYIGNELFEKTIGVVGLGKIGYGVAKRLKGFDANILAYDPIVSKELADRIGVKLVELDELIEKSDIITIHAPKMPETIDLFNKERLEKCKDGVVIVNCARGGIVNEADLLASLDSGKVSAAALDVYSSEPPADFTLAKHPKVVATPHLGASTEEAQVKVADMILDQMIEYFEKNVARNAVNFVSIDEEIQPIIAPYFELAQRLGKLFNQGKQGHLKEVAISFYGDTINVPVEPISAHLMVGALKSAETELINPVNALAICRDREISIEIAKKDLALTSHTNLIACDFKTDEGFYHFAGTVFAKDQFHLTECGEFTCDANLEGNMLFVENEDIPGVVGQLGLVLANYNVNIGHLSLGRLKDKKDALNVFNLDSPIGEGVINELKTVKGVKQVYTAEI